MDTENRVAVDTPEILRVNGKIATLRRARKTHKCVECGLPIEPKTHYYSVTLGGSGLGSLKFPDDIHIECINKYLGGK